MHTGGVGDGILMPVPALCLFSYINEALQSDAIISIMAKFNWQRAAIVYLKTSGAYVQHTHGRHACMQMRSKAANTCMPATPSTHAWSYGCATDVHVPSRCLLRFCSWCVVASLVIRTTLSSPKPLPRAPSSPCRCLIHRQMQRFVACSHMESSSDIESVTTHNTGMERGRGTRIDGRWSDARLCCSFLGIHHHDLPHLHRQRGECHCRSRYERRHLCIHRCERYGSKHRDATTARAT